jgi:hypothetical protein
VTLMIAWDSSALIKINLLNSRIWKYLELSSLH